MDFLVFSDDWGRHPTTCEHLFRALLPEHRVVWVNTIGTRSPRLSLYDLRRALEKLREYGGSDGGAAPTLPDNLSVLAPRMYPFNQWGFCRRYNRRSVRAVVAAELARRSFDRYAVVTSLPVAGDYFDDHASSPRVYYCVDDFTGMPGVSPRLIRRMETELIERCDVLLYTATPLASKFAGAGKEAIYLPHGVSYEHFQGEDRAELSRPLTSPVVGFFGHVSEWIDLSLLRELVGANPAWTFLFVGGHDVDVSRLREAPNVVWMGPVPYERLPAVARWFDVGMIPYSTTDPRIRTVNPVKLREYYALGLPVVSVPLPEVERLGGDTYVAEGAAGFAEAIERALAEDSPERREARRAIARDSSWTDRGRRLIEAIEAVR